MVCVFTVQGLSSTLVKALSLICFQFVFPAEGNTKIPQAHASACNGCGCCICTCGCPAGCTGGACGACCAWGACCWGCRWGDWPTWTKNCTGQERKRSDEVDLDGLCVHSQGLSSTLVKALSLICFQFVCLAPLRGHCKISSKKKQHKQQEQQKIAKTKRISESDNNT